MATEFTPVKLVDKDGVLHVARTAKEEVDMRGNRGFRSAPSGKKTTTKPEPGSNPS